MEPITGGRLEVFAAGPDGTLGHIWEITPNGDWSGWNDLGSPVIRWWPAVFQNADGRLEVFASDVNGNLGHMWQTSANNGWSEWADMGQAAQSSPVVFQNLSGALDVFAVGADGNLGHMSQTAPNNGWSGWEVLGPAVFGRPAVYQVANGGLEVFAIATDDGYLGIAWQAAPNDGWYPWVPDWGPAIEPYGPPAVCQNADGRLEVFGIGTDGYLGHMWQTAPNNGWSGWERLSQVPVTGAPAVFQNADGRLEVFGIGPDGSTLGHIWQMTPNDGWSEWADLPASLQGQYGAPPAVFQTADGRLRVFAIGTDGNLGSIWQTAPNNGWSNWASFEVPVTGYPVVFQNLQLLTMPATLSIEVTGPTSVEAWGADPFPFPPNPSYDVAMAPSLTVAFDAGNAVDPFDPFGFVCSETYLPTIADAGAGFPPNASVPITVVGGVANSPAIVEIATDANGQASAVTSVVQQGSYSTLPTLPGQTSAATSGSTGSGLTLNVYWEPAFAGPRFAVSATNLSLPVVCTFIDDLATAPEPPPGPIEYGPDGYHGRFQVKLQQLYLDANGNPLPATSGWVWSEFDALGNPLGLDSGGVPIPGAPIFVDLYGSEATETVDGQPLSAANQAQEGGSVTTSAAVPLLLRQVTSILRCAYSVELDDDPNESDMVPTYYESVTPPFQVGLLPSTFLQVNAIPMALVYCPPGSKSTEAFTYQTGYQVALTVSDTQDQAYSVATDIGNSLQVSSQLDVGVSASFLGFTLGFDFTSSSTTTQTWDTTTTTGLDQAIEDDQTVTVSYSQSFGATVGPSVPGDDTATWEEEPFWEDQVLLIVNPQYAVWDYWGFQALQFVGSWPLPVPVQIGELYAVASGAADGDYILTNPASAVSPQVTLSQSDCANLVALDPSSDRGDGKAPLLGAPRFLLLAEDVSFGTQIAAGSIGMGTPTGQVLDNAVALQIQTVDTTDYSKVTTTTAKYTAQTQTKYTLQLQTSEGVKYNLGFKLGGGGNGSGNSVGVAVSGSDNTVLGSSASTANTDSLTITYQRKASLDYKTVTTVTGNLSDQGPQTTVKGNGGTAGQNVLPVSATTGFTAGQQVVIDLGKPDIAGTQGGQEYHTIATVQGGTSLTFVDNLAFTHYNGENVQAFWQLMNVNVHRDLVFGGIAFQDPNAQEP